MDLVLIENLLFYINSVIAVFCLIFFTYVYFKLLYTDKLETTLHIKQLFDKYKRYHIMKKSLIYLVISYYFIFLGRLVIHFNMLKIFFEVFFLYTNVFLALVARDFYKLLKEWVPETKK